ncbi:hypothetical protein N7474_000510 [Penicillium riverlandense]|uniref:uncharacterized protein n=1 Tax=Penicillium riverlandense TaxID=1903569 RepID=UPI002548D87A|nr:uncharacterized protein N7474_000510 [Penicillium riverlandense]KAJ5832199.1 hypothetical protein N7474_000510 [Penicillium riverlandense]
MFAPGQEAQLSKEEIKVTISLFSVALSQDSLLTNNSSQAGEIEASNTVRMVIAGGFLLYLSPFAVDFARKFL